MPSSTAEPAYPNMSVGDHPLRRLLNDELHARPQLKVTEPALVVHLAMLHEPGAGLEAELEHLARLGAMHPEKHPERRHVLLEIGEVRLKWERHAEFSTITVLRPIEALPEEDASSGLPGLTPELQAWADALPGQRLVAIRLRIEAGAKTMRSRESLAALFPDGEVAGSYVNGGDAMAWTDFRIRDDGFTRILVRNLSLNPARMGRLVQRLLEVETYRMMALLALPLARALSAELARMEIRLVEIVDRTARAATPIEEHELLDRLTLLATEVEAAANRTRYRFGAAAAYAALVDKRLSELREDRITGLQRIGVFLQRRFQPAVATCLAMRRRQEELADGIARAGAMLRTRVDVQLAEQNADLLRSMEERARAQLRLQEAVEGLSVVAISYYLIGLLKVLLEGLPALGVPVTGYAVSAIAVPVVLGGAWIALRRLRRTLRHRE